MFSNCQFLNKSSCHNQPNIFQNNGLSYSQHKKEEKPGVTGSNFADDLIQELTLKNKVLTAQLSEYRILVASLNHRLCERQQRASHLTLPIHYSQEKEPAKLRTIQEQFSTMSEITNPSERKAKGDSQLNSLSTLLGSHSIQVQGQTWESYISATRRALSERKAALSFIQRIQQMRQQLEPGDPTIRELWNWLKRIGANYHCLLQYEQSRTQSLFTRK